MVLLILAGAAIFFVAMRLHFPAIHARTRCKAGERCRQQDCWSAWQAWLRRTGSGGSTAQQAHFTALDGTVRVKKGNGNSWVTADYSIPLEKGDVVQTGSEGMAKVVFNDGTSYTVKQDSLIVIEENSANDQQQTNVAVTVSTGTVDLSTATYSQGSKSQVIVAGATASLAPESAAQVHNDPKADQHEILMKKGTRRGHAQRRNRTTGQLGKSELPGAAVASWKRPKKSARPLRSLPPTWRRCFLPARQPRMSNFPGPPMANAVGYRLRISRNPYFSSTLVDKKVNTAAVTVTSLGEGAYYWMVQSYDAAGKNRWRARRTASPSFPRAKKPKPSNLELDPFIQHGHVIEVTGKTQTGARVMVNGSEVPMINCGWRFPLLHAAAADRGSGDYGNGANGAGRSEHAAEENHYPVENTISGGRIRPPAEQASRQWQQDSRGTGSNRVSSSSADAGHLVE